MYFVFLPIPIYVQCNPNLVTSYLVTNPDLVTILQKTFFLVHKNIDIAKHALCSLSSSSFMGLNSFCNCKYYLFHQMLRHPILNLRFLIFFPDFKCLFSTFQSYYTTKIRQNTIKISFA